jgi:hypothetical protein
VELQEIEPTCPPKAVAGEVVPVTLQARVTDIGTLELNAVPVGGSERWKVEFDACGDRCRGCRLKLSSLVRKPAGPWLRAFCGWLAKLQCPACHRGLALHATACEMALCMILINLYQ